MPPLAAAFICCLCVLFGANPIAIKITFAGLGVFTTAALRFAMAALAISLWARMTGKRIRIRKNQVSEMLIFSSIFTVQLSLFYLGLSKTYASRGTLIINLLPFFILFLGRFFIPGEQITMRRFLGMAMAFIGVALTTLNDGGGSGSLRTGDAMIFTATMIWACGMVYLKRIIQDYSPFQLVLYSMVFAVPFFLLEGWLWDEAMISHIDAKIVVSLLYQGLVTASFGFVAWNTMLQKYGAVSLHSFVFIMPIAGVILGGVVLGEPITWEILASLCLVVVGLLIIHLHAGAIPPIFPLRRGF
jgi:drug/metabolite transporter (DMT)-like permease